MDAQFKSLESLDLNISSLNKCSLLSWHMKALQKMFILEKYKFKRTVLFDEGPFKTHYGLVHINAERVKRNTLPRAVIYCSIDLNENLKRIKNRKTATEKVSRIHNNLNSEKFEHLVTYTHKAAASNYQFVKNLGIPVIEIDLTNSLNDSDLDMLDHFIAAYTNTM